MPFCALLTEAFPDQGPNSRRWSPNDNSFLSIPRRALSSSIRTDFYEGCVFHARAWKNLSFLIPFLWREVYPISVISPLRRNCFHDRQIPFRFPRGPHSFRKFLRLRERLLVIPSGGGESQVEDPWTIKNSKHMAIRWLKIWRLLVSRRMSCVSLTRKLRTLSVWSICTRVLECTVLVYTSKDREVPEVELHLMALNLFNVHWLRNV